MADSINQLHEDRCAIFLETGVFAALESSERTYTNLIIKFKDGRRLGDTGRRRNKLNKFRHVP